MRCRGPGGRLKDSDYQALVKRLLGGCGPWIWALKGRLDRLPRPRCQWGGKDTTIAKLADYYQSKVFSPLGRRRYVSGGGLGPTGIHSERLGCRIVRQVSGSDPGSVVYDAILAPNRGARIVFVDTAGRMHNKASQELAKIDKIIKGRGIGEAHYKKLIVLDSTTGQNQISQAELFDKAIGLDGLILSKYDSLAKGGALVQIGDRLGIPVAFVGTGEGYGDIHPFDKDEFLDALVGLTQ